MINDSQKLTVSQFTYNNITQLDSELTITNHNIIKSLCIAYLFSYLYII